MWRRGDDGSYTKSVLTSVSVRPSVLPGVTIDVDALFASPYFPVNAKIAAVRAGSSSRRRSPCPVRLQRPFPPPNRRSLVASNNRQFSPGKAASVG